MNNRNFDIKTYMEGVNRELRYIYLDGKNRIFRAIDERLQTRSHTFPRGVIPDYEEWLESLDKYTDEDYKLHDEYYTQDCLGRGKDVVEEHKSYNNLPRRIE